jgi:hypothetical protein
MENAILILLLGAGAFFVGLLVYKVVGGARAASRASARARDDLAQKVAGFSTEYLRQRLLLHPYLVAMGRDTTVKVLLSRVAQGDEVALARDYPRSKLYRMLASAEANAGRQGRPEAVDAISEVSDLLQELARRNR